MGTRQTQNKILDTAIALFNTESTTKISINRIANDCGISKGNLYYHFKTKEEIILSVWSRIQDEIDNEWGNDLDNPTINYMAIMTQRQLQLIWRFRFFYRELNTLLDRDPELKYRFRLLRQKRIKKIQKFIDALIDNNIILPQKDPKTLPGLIKAAWVITDYWLSFISVDDKEINMQSMQEGFELLIHLFKPVLTEKALNDIPNSLRLFSLDV